MNINRIIREEIEKYIIKENINLDSLASHVKPLNACFNEIKRFSTSNNQNVNKFMNNLYIYIAQIIGAIERCVRMNNLNEAFRFSDYGIEVPQELGGNLVYNMKSGYHKTKNLLNQFVNNGGYASNANYGTINKYTVKQERLSVLLSYLPKYQQNYKKVENEIIRLTQAPRNALYEIQQLYNDFRQLKANAQGTNP